MPQDSFEYLWRRVKPPEALPKTAPFGYRKSLEDGMAIERDVAVAMRDGVRIYIDLFRPEGVASDLPVLIAWGPYGKHNPRGVYERFHNNASVKPEWISRHCGFESPDPLYWCRHGYAVIYADPRGTWNSEGKATFWSSDEARDFHDLIEWAGIQPWSNGKVGLAGVSYFAIMQWQVAALRPAHLAAINPWEGYSDSYRERLKHGGIPETLFGPQWLDRSIYARGEVEDVNAMIEQHPFFDAYWKTKAPDLSRIEVPAYVVASWSDQGLHTRGTLEGFKQMSSRQKWLEVHGRYKWEYFHHPDNVEKQRAFFDHFLKGSSDEVLQWPRVNIEVREAHYQGRMRAETEWPLARTRYTRLYLDGASGTLQDTAPAQEAEARYDARQGRSTFDHRFTQDTELTGHMKLRLWVETTEGHDMDLLVAVQKLDAQGREVPFAFFSVYDNGPVALGWLRVSHREQDPRRSTEWQPWLLHERELPLQPGECVPVDIEIWASSTLFRAGESLRVVVQGHDYFELTPKGPMLGHNDLRNEGTHILRTGGRYDAHLLMPVIPPTTEKTP
ncbi:CocE/NonD family hydrolase [Ramlibacter sp. AW1]|uniref:CocE/NonD family hydrolase n=1 Tax=Ramlibacter aurantiacus TaxID=2801330 RepID=A0A937D095_9BURK|nr:CocE/NonD family hydrolase [Ramlibacter aurantiacus]MBL0419194.1 CocE/NonD family hydrolase [Ramlibacter aurantiacus]